MSDDSPDSKEQEKPKKAWDRPISQQRFEEVLAFRKVSSNCERCNVSRWYYIKSKKSGDELGVTFMLTGESDDRYETLSYYTRTCLNCGNIQNFARVIIQSSEMKMSSGES